MSDNFFTKESVKFTFVDDCFFDSDNDYLIEIKIKKSILHKLIEISHPHSSSNNFVTNTEVEVLKYLASGLNNSQIAKKMHVSVHTTKAHIHNILKKLSVQGRTEAVVKAIRDNLIDI